MVKRLFFCKRKSISCESTFESPNKQQRRPGLGREWTIKTFLLILAALLTIVCFLLKNKKAIRSTRAQKVAVFLSGWAKSVCVHACSSLWWGVMHFCVCVCQGKTLIQNIAPSSFCIHILLKEFNAPFATQLFIYIRHSLLLCQINLMFWGESQKASSQDEAAASCWLGWPYLRSSRVLR